MANAALRLRVIEGGAEPRVAFSAAPELAGLNLPDRIPPPQSRLSALRILAAVVISLGVHGGIFAWVMQRQMDEEARAEGGAEEQIVVEGVSMVLIDSADSEISDGTESLPEAKAVPTPPVVEAEPQEMTVAVADDAPTPIVEAVRPVDVADSPTPVEQPPEVLESQPADTARLVPEERSAVAAADAPAIPSPEEAAAETPPESAPAVAAEAVAATLAADATATAASEFAVAAEDVVAAAPVMDDAPPSQIVPAVADAATTVVDDTALTTMAEHVAIAAVDMTPPEPESQPTPPPQPKPAPPRTAKPAAKPVAKPAEKPAAKPAQTPPARRSEQSTASIAEQAARAPKPGTAGAGGASSEERGGAGVSSYQAKLVARLRRFRVYPEAARSQGLKGTAVVTFTVNASGTVTRASLAKSSGHAVLDQAAVQMVHRASPFPPIPASIGQKSLTVSAPVRFDKR